MDENIGIIDFSNITDTHLYIDSCNSYGTTNISPELTLSNISWASLVEEELGDSISDKILSGSVIREDIEVIKGIKYTKNVSNIKKVYRDILIKDNGDISCKDRDKDKNDNDDDNHELSEIQELSKIMKLKYETIEDLELLEYQTLISNYLRKQLKNNICELSSNMKDMINKLEWLRNVSNYFSKKLGLKKHVHDNSKKTKEFSRSSYKFCNYGHECEFNYNINKYNGCFAQHYVHNIVHADLTELTGYLRNIIEKNTKMTPELSNEIIKSINTVSFVVNHMFDELRQTNNLSHVDRTPKKKKNNTNKNKNKNNKNIKNYNNYKNNRTLKP
jgi:hypothetical protein